MNIDFFEVNGVCIAQIESDDIIIRDVRDALDVLSECYSSGANSIIIDEKNIIPDFFDLKNGLAGEILRKFSMYHFKIAIIGDFSDVSSKSLRAFIYESNRAGDTCFVHSAEEAKERLVHINKARP
ncbi:MAG: DUF4180 domain-containing protein [candidate division WOR-3 bacterium]|jgi:hypothetical protein